MARVPLVVVRTSVRPPTRSGVQSSGELPRSKPSMGSPPRSPAKSTGSGARAAARERAAASLATGMTRAQPAPKAATTMVVARKTSTTRATRPARSSSGNSPGMRATCTCMTGRALPAAVAERADLQTERIQVDETLGVLLAVDAVSFEGHEVRAVEGARRAAPRHGDRALVELEPNRARDVALHLVDEPLERLALESEGLQGAVGRMEDGAARRLVDAAGLHAHVAVLDEVDPPNAVLASEPVQGLQQGHGPEPLSVHRHGIARLVLDLHVHRHVRRRLG